MYGEVITVGIILSLVFSQLTGLSPAGLIVPGYMALALHSPLKMLLTLAVALVTLLLYNGVARVTILYGQRRFAVIVLLSLAVGWAFSLLPFVPAGISVIGYIIPGIIAKECSRQGILKTLISLAFVTAATALVSMLLGAAIL